MTAVNALNADATLTAADYAGLPVKANALAVAAPLDLRVWLIGAALIGLMVDALASLWIGLLPKKQKSRLLDFIK